MAEARVEEEEEENLRGDAERVVRRQGTGSGGRADRRKPEHRLSQGPLSSIRAAIKRTSNRSTSETPREPDRERARRRPEITILSAEPLSSASWFPGASAGVPPPPPPAAQIWGPTIPTCSQPPSYEDVIREKTQEQVRRPSSSSASPCPRPVSTTTIATQTEPGPSPEAHDPVRPVRPSRPPLLGPHAADQSGDALPYSPVPCNDLPPPTSCCTARSERPRPRPRSRFTNEVKVQTLVKLREDGLETLAARTGSDAAGCPESRGPYLQELLEAFSSDDWGFCDRHGDDGTPSTSEDEEDKEDAEDEDMAALRARIQAFEAAADAPKEAAKPEPRPRPRLQGQQPRPSPPTVAPKPKNFLPAGKISSKESCTEEPGPDDTAPHEDCTRQSSKNPSVAPKPPGLADPSPSAAPVPAPRPPPPKIIPAEASPSAKPPPRPPVAPRAGAAAAPQEKASSPGHMTPVTPPRPGTPADTPAGSDATLDAAEQPAKLENVRPDVPCKPAPPSARRTAPALAPKPSGISPTPPEVDRVPVKPRVQPAPVQARPAPPLRKGPPVPAKADSDPRPPSRPSAVKLLPLRPPPIKSTPARPPPPVAVPSANQAPPPSKGAGPPPQAQRSSRRGPPLPPRPQPGHPLFKEDVKQEVLIVLDDVAPPAEGVVQTQTSSLLDLDLDLQPEPAQQDSRSELSQDGQSEPGTRDGQSEPGTQDGQSEPGTQDGQSEPSPQDIQSKPVLVDVDLSESQSILPLQKQTDPPVVSGPRCIALFDFEGEQEDELTFSQGDVIALLELAGSDWGRGRIHGREGMFPLRFAKVLEPLPPPDGAADTEGTTQCDTEEWVVALFDFPGQSPEDLSFQQGALILVSEHVDSDWRRGKADGREGLFPAAFTQACVGAPPPVRPIPGQQAARGGVAKAVFDFTGESEDELTLKVGDVITQVEPVDEQWILGVVGGKRGIVPKNYISLL